MTATSIVYEAILYNQRIDSLAVFMRFNNGSVVVDFGEDFITSETTTLTKWKQNGWEVIELEANLNPVNEETSTHEY